MFIADPCIKNISYSTGAILLLMSMTLPKGCDAEYDY